MSKYNHCVYMYCGSIYDLSGYIIENPAILLDKSTGTVHGYGDTKTVTAKMVNMADAYNKAGFTEEAASLMLLDFSDAYYKGISNEEICYVIRRAMEYTASSFQPALCEHAIKPDFKEWLNSEMKRVPIDLSEKYF